MMKYAIFATVSLLSMRPLCAEDMAWERWQRERITQATPAFLDADAPLHRYVLYAQLYNPDVEAMLWRWKAALDEVVPARSWPDPTLTFGHFLRPVETRVGPQQQRLGVAQPIPWPDELNVRQRAALVAAEIAQWRYEDRRAELAAQVVDAYFGYYYMERAIAVTEGNMQLVAYLEEVVRSRFRSGGDEHGALIKVQVELGKLEDHLGSLRDGLRPAAARLNALLGRRPGLAVAAVDSPQTAHFDADSLRARALGNNPNVQMLRAAVERAQYAVELAAKEGRPNLMVGLDYLRTGEREAAGAQSGSDPLVVMASVSVPLWRGKYRGKSDAATAHLQAARSALRDGEIALLADLEDALFQWRESQRRAVLYRDNLLPKAEQSLNVAQQGFAAGRSSFFELIDVQRTLLELQLAYERACVDGARQMARIERLVGRRLPSRSAIERELLSNE